MTTRVAAGDQLANWSPSDTGEQKIAIHLPGLPNLPTPIPGITQLLARAGFNVLQPHYPGTYESEGQFDPYETYRCVAHWISHLESGDVVDLKRESLLGIKAGPDLLSCHSFGSYVGFKALRQEVHVKKAMFFGTSFRYGIDGQQYGVRGDKTEHSRFLERAYAKCFRSSQKGIIEEFFVRNSKELFEFENSSASMVRCLAVAPDSDPTIDYAASEDGVKGIFESYPNLFSLDRFLVARGAGHSVASMLTPEVSKSILEWLNDE